MIFNSNYIETFRKKRKKETLIFFIIFYIVGIFGILVPATFSIFLKLIPLALLLSFIALVLFYQVQFTNKAGLVFVSIFIIGFVVEMLGVNTKLIFGDYQYGNSLGLKIFKTPLIIGINWLLLVYVTSSILENIKIHNIFKVVLASLIMVLYDVVLEQVAPKLDMWNWNTRAIPFQNYLAWLIIALCFHSIIKLFRVNTQNYLASIILVCQFLFFLVLLICLK